MKFDIFITATEKDFNKLPFVVDSIYRFCLNLQDLDQIYICSPNGTKFPFGISVKDSDVLSFDRERIKYRKNWCFQQFLKLFQNVTKNDFYYTIDADTIWNQPFELFSNGVPVWYIGWSQRNQPYYSFNSMMFPNTFEPRSTYLADMNLFSKSVIRNMLHKFSYTQESFIDKACDIITEYCYPSEADIYGNYLYNFNVPYCYKHLKTICNGKDRYWEDSEIGDYINQMRLSNYDTFSMHSWC
jgi:hypothetical protein